jgi:hypothetical protein
LSRRKNADRITSFIAPSVTLSALASAAVAEGRVVRAARAGRFAGAFVVLRGFLVVVFLAIGALIPSRKF